MTRLYFNRLADSDKALLFSENLEQVLTITEGELKLFLAKNGFFGLELYDLKDFLVSEDNLAEVKEMPASPDVPIHMYHGKMGVYFTRGNAVERRTYALFPSHIADRIRDTLFEMGFTVRELTRENG